MVIIKSRSLSPSNWPVYHSGIGNTGACLLDTTASTSTSVLWWNNTSPSASVVTLGTIAASNTSGATQVMYSFHSVSGYSSIGSYSGTGATGNSITGLGFKPAWLMIKRTDASGDSWVIHDNTRTPSGTVDEILLANSSSAELTNASYAVDFDADGFTLQTTNVGWNASGGTYIYMAFADTRDATFFGDTSGNGNNWTPNALNNTDVVPDSPVTNWCTLNNLGSGNATFKEGNLFADLSVSSGAAGATFSANSGKWYWEVVGNSYSNNGITIGVRNTDNSSEQTYNSNGVFYYANAGDIYVDGSVTDTVASFGVNDIIGVALNADDDEVSFYKNNTLQITKDLPQTDKTWHAQFGEGTSSGNNSFNVNFGQDSSFAGNETPQGNTDDNGQGDFYYAPPSGFLALNRNNLPTPDILDPADYFNTVLYTGTGAAISVTGVGFQPDLLWIKTRSFAQWHALFDSVRGASIGSLSSNTTGAETTTQKITSFDADGFTDSDGTYQFTNTSGETHVAWNWLAGGTAVSNTDGSITSQVSANQDAGFSVVSYVGNATAGASVGHGLSQDLDFIVIKNRDTTSSWVVQTNKSDVQKYLYLNDTRAESTTTLFQIDITKSNDGTWSMGGTNLGVNGNNENYIAYCFHSVEGYSKIGSYTGNGSSDGTFVHCGFRPAFVMVKRTDATSDWLAMDNKRASYNFVDRWLNPNTSSAESTTASDFIDFTSNGFKWRYSGANNASGGSYIFIAFAEAPFKSANAR